jgi:hypothetical protein
MDVRGSERLCSITISLVSTYMSVNVYGDISRSLRVMLDGEVAGVLGDMQLMVRDETTF